LPQPPGLCQSLRQVRHTELFHNAQRSCSFRALRRRSQGYVTRTVPAKIDLWEVRPGCNDITPANHVPPKAEDVETATGNRRVFQEYEIEPTPCGW
jgi:hypothetical protein